MPFQRLEPVPLLSSGSLAQRRMRAHRVPAVFSGGAPEAVVAATLRELAPSVAVLHDRVLGRGLANVDHIAVGPSGVFVIDTRPAGGPVRVSRRPFGPAVLRVGGLDRTGMLETLDAQVAAVARVLAGIDSRVMLTGVLCFVDESGRVEDGLPLLRTLTIRGVPLLCPRRLARRVMRRGPLTDEHARRICDGLAEHLPAG